MEILTSQQAKISFERDFSGCGDFNLRFIEPSDGFYIYLANIGNFSDRTFISETIIKPLTHMGGTPSTKKEFFGVIASSELSDIPNYKEAKEKVLSGCAVIFTDIGGEVVFLAIPAKNGNGRSVSEPDSEVVVRGPREGFIENAEDNIALIRKRIRTEKLKIITLNCGTFTKTSVNILYIDGVANPDTVKRVKKSIEKMKMPAVIDSGYVEHYLQKNIPSLFTNVGNSEKPDKVAAKLIEGRVAVICDGSPVVLTVPYLFVESLQSAEDYLKTPYYATFIRCIRLISIFISLYLPSLYLALLEHHTSSIPYKLYKTVIEARQDIPFGIFGELVVILLIFELIREVGIRMPRAVGDAVGIVAGLILGDAAVSAGIASPPVIMVAALTAVSSFSMPPYMNSIMLVRLLNLIAAKLFGIEGIVISVTFLFIALCRKESFGIPYLSPFTPINPKGLTDAVLTVPKEALSHAENEIYPKKKGASE